MKEQFRRRRLPHWDPPGATFFVTSCLHGSIPAQGLLEIRRYERDLLKKHASGSLQLSKEDIWKKVFVEREKWLDQEPAVKHLERAELAEIVVNSLHHFDGERYELISYVIMPSHFHWLFRPLPEWAASLPEGKSPRQVIMHSIKGYTAHECNRILQKSGRFWQDESYDHCVRNEAELERIVEYIHCNPVKAGLCQYPEEWRFSTAFTRIVGRASGLPEKPIS